MYKFCGFNFRGDACPRKLVPNENFCVYGILSGCDFHVRKTMHVIVNRKWKGVRRRCQCDVTFRPAWVRLRLWNTWKNLFSARAMSAVYIGTQGGFGHTLYTHISTTWWDLGLMSHHSGPTSTRIVLLTVATVDHVTALNHLVLAYNFWVKEIA